MKNLLIGILLYTISQTLVWFQSNGQFLWPFFKKNTWFIALLGSGIAYMFIKGTGYIAAHYDGQIWPGRFIGFSIGIVTYSIFTYYLMGEGMNLKTTICVMLALCILLIQLFWKT